MSDAAGWGAFDCVEGDVAELVARIRFTPVKSTESETRHVFVRTLCLGSTSQLGLFRGLLD